MAGYENGWRDCDILSSVTGLGKDIPQIVMDWDKIKSLNVKSAFSSSHCLLVTYDVDSQDSLSSLVEFGRSAIQQVRLALVIRMRSGIYLDLVNTTKLPFMVAGDMGNGRMQFMCPVVGEMEPRQQQSMCQQAYTSYRGKILRVALIGMEPSVVLTRKGIDGSDKRLLDLMATALDFTPLTNYP